MEQEGRASTYISSGDRRVGGLGLGGKTRGHAEGRDVHLHQLKGSCSRQWL